MACLYVPYFLVVCSPSVASATWLFDVYQTDLLASKRGVLFLTGDLVLFRDTFIESLMVTVILIEVDKPKKRREKLVLKSERWNIALTGNEVKKEAKYRRSPLYNQVF
jgi:hypothetical protein